MIQVGAGLENLVVCRPLLALSGSVNVRMAIALLTLTFSLLLTVSNALPTARCCASLLTAANHITAVISKFERNYRFCCTRGLGPVSMLESLTLKPISYLCSFVCIPYVTRKLTAVFCPSLFLLTR